MTGKLLAWLPGKTALPQKGRAGGKCESEKNNEYTFVSLRTAKAPFGEVV